MTEAASVAAVASKTAPAVRGSMAAIATPSGVNDVARMERSAIRVGRSAWQVLPGFRSRSIRATLVDMLEKTLGKRHAHANPQRNPPRYLDVYWQRSLRARRPHADRR